MADLQNLPPSPAILSPSRLRRVIQIIRAPVLVTLGLYIASYPDTAHERAAWSEQMYYVATWILPEGYDIARFYSTWGLQLIVLGIHYSPRAKDILANRTFLWLGKNSFAVYLLHGVFIRTFLTWAMYGITIPADVTHEDGTVTRGPSLEEKGPLAKAFWFPVFFIVLYGASHIWTTIVDPKCAEWTRAIEKYVWKDESLDGMLGRQATQAVAKRDDENENEKLIPAT